MNTYTVQAKRWARGWELHIFDAEGAEVGVTQSHTIAGADRMVRDYLALLFDAEPDSFELDIRPDLGADVAAEVERARRATREAEQAQKDAARRWSALARHLKEERGLTGGDVAAVLDVSPQRVSQLVKSA